MGKESVAIEMSQPQLNVEESQQLLSMELSFRSCSRLLQRVSPELEEQEEGTTQHGSKSENLKLTK